MEEIGHGGLWQSWLENEVRQGEIEERRSAGKGLNKHIYIYQKFLNSENFKWIKIFEVWKFQNLSPTARPSGPERPRSRPSRRRRRRRRGRSTSDPPKVLLAAAKLAVASMKRAAMIARPRARDMIERPLWSPKIKWIWMFPLKET